MSQRAVRVASPAHFGDWLTDRMAAVGFSSNSDLAREAGVPDSAVSRWRAGATQPTVAQLRRLTPALQASLLELLVAAGHLTLAEAGLKETRQPVRIARSTRDAIRQDPELPDDLKHLLEVQYEAMRALAEARAPRRAAGRARR